MERNLFHRRGQSLVVPVEVCHQTFLEGEDRADLRREKMRLETDQGDLDHAGLQHFDDVVRVVLEHLKTDFRVGFMVVKQDLLEQGIRIGSSLFSSLKYGNLIPFFCRGLNSFFEIHKNTSDCD